MSRPRIVGRWQGKLRQANRRQRSEEHTSELQSRLHLVCRLLLEKKTTNMYALYQCLSSLMMRITTHAVRLHCRFDAVRPSPLRDASTEMLCAATSSPCCVSAAP